MQKPHNQNTLQGFKKHKLLKQKLRRDMTPAENKLWMRFKNRDFKGLKIRRQHGIGPYIVDFFCPEKKLVIEVDGDIHALDDQIKKDNQRELYLKNLGLQIVRYYNNDILGNLEGVMQDLYGRV